MVWKGEADLLLWSNPPYLLTIPFFDKEERDPQSTFRKHSRESVLPTMPPKQAEDIEVGSMEKKSMPTWHIMTKEDALAQLGLPADIRRKGLTTGEAKARLDEYGYNQLTEKEKITLLERIWKQVNNVLVGILVFVAVVSLAKGIVTSGESRVTNFIEVGLISFVIT